MMKRKTPFIIQLAAILILIMTVVPAGAQGSLIIGEIILPEIPFKLHYVNGYQIAADKKSLFAVMMDLASGKVSKVELRDYLKKNSKRREEQEGISLFA